jgi:hypothetical protein
VDCHSGLLARKTWMTPLAARSRLMCAWVSMVVQVGPANRAVDMGRIQVNLLKAGACLVLCRALMVFLISS